MRFSLGLLLVALMAGAALAQPASLPYDVSPYQLQATLERSSGPQTLATQILISMPAGKAGTELYRLGVMGYDASTISFTPPSGLIYGGQSVSISVQVNAAKLAAGFYIFPIWIQSANSRLTAVELSLDVTDSGAASLDPPSPSDPPATPSDQPPDTSSTIRIVPHVATGLNWTTAIEFVNPNSTPTALEVSFFDPEGQPTSFPVDGAQCSTLPVNVPGNGSYSVLLQDNVSPAIRVGSASIRLVSGDAVGISTTYHQAVPDHEVSIPVVSPAGTLTFGFDNTPGRSTSVAIANSSPAAQNVTVIAYDSSGVRLLAWDIPLAAGGQTAFSLPAAEPALNGIAGVLSLSAPTPGLSGFALLFQGDRFRPLATY